MTNRRRVLLADDHAMFLEAIEKLIEEHCDVVGRAGDGERALAEVARLQPDVVVLDVAMPRLNGLETARQVKQIAPETRVVFLTMNADPDVAAEAFRAGASGYVLKSAAAAELVAAIGDRSAHRLPASSHVAATPLTERQREVIRLLASGHSMKQVAAILKIVPRTVAFHKYRIMDAFHLRTTADLVQFAVRQRIV